MNRILHYAELKRRTPGSTHPMYACYSVQTKNIPEYDVQCVLDLGIRDLISFTIFDAEEIRDSEQTYPGPHFNQTPPIYIGRRVPIESYILALGKAVVDQLISKGASFMCVKRDGTFAPMYEPDAVTLEEYLKQQEVEEEIDSEDLAQSEDVIRKRISKDLKIAARLLDEAKDPESTLAALRLTLKLCGEVTQVLETGEKSKR